MIKFLKNNTIYKGKAYLKFEKNPFYEEHFDNKKEQYISILDTILINFFNKFYLSKRIKTDGYSYDEEKLILIKRQGLKIKTKIDLIDKDFKVVETKIIDDYTTNIEIDNPNNIKVYLKYYVTNKNDIKVGDLSFAWDLVQEDIVDLDVASKKDNFCSIGFNKKQNKWIALCQNPKLFGIGDLNKYNESIKTLDEAKKCTIEYIKNNNK